jgi:flagellar biogenesis protein FliO
MRRAVLTMAAAVGLLLAGSVRAAAPSDGDLRLIPPPSTSRAAQKESKTSRGAQPRQKTGSNWWTTLGGLIAVLALVLLTAKVLRKSAPAAQQTLPPEVIQVLGRKALDYRHTIHLVRFGSRLLMLGASQEGVTTLSEITDPVEIDTLAGLCKPSEPATVANTFGQLFRRFQNADPEPAEDDSDERLQPESQAEPESDPAILRLQERLQSSTRADLGDAISPVPTEAAG